MTLSCRTYIDDAFLFARQKLFSAESEMAAIIEANDIKTQFAKSFVLCLLARNERLGDFGNRASLQMESWNCAGYLNFPAYI